MYLISDATGPVSLDTNNPLTVTNTGTVVGTSAAVTASSVAGTLTNAGTILATGLASAGVGFNAGGTLDNQPGGIIAGAGAGILVMGAAGEIANPGSITGSHGVELDAGGNVVNSTTILGQEASVLVTDAAGSLYNLGSIAATGLGGAGVGIQAGGTVLNAPNASIFGNETGVVMDGGASRLESKGAIAGGTYAVRFLGTLDNRLVADPTATFNGLVQGVGSGSNTLELAGGSGTLSDFANGSGTVAEGGQSWAFEQFGTIAIDAGGAWDLAGSIAGNGTVAIAGSLDVSGTVDLASTGVFQVEGGTLEVAGALAEGAQIQFQPDSALILDLPATFAGLPGGRPSTTYAGPKLVGFGVGDEIDLKAVRTVPGSTVSYDPNTGALELAEMGIPSAILGFEPSKSLASGTFSAADDGTGGTLITFTPAKSPSDSDSGGGTGSNSGTGGTGTTGPAGPASDNGLYNLSTTYDFTASTPTASIT